MLRGRQAISMQCLKNLPFIKKKKKKKAALHYFILNGGS